MRTLLVLLALATPAIAQAPIGAEEFEALVTGRTLTYGAPGEEPYGIEHYFPNRRVTWAFMGSDECLEGTWHEEPTPSGPAICFDYEDDLGPQCWHVYREGESLRAEFLGSDGPSMLYQLDEPEGGLVCGGVGV